MHLMRDLRDRHGMTFVFSTHDPRVVAHAVRVVTLVDAGWRGTSRSPGAPHEILPHIGKDRGGGEGLTRWPHGAPRMRRAARSSPWRGAPAPRGRGGARVALGGRRLAPDGAQVHAPRLPPPDDRLLFPAPGGADALFRLRLDAVATPSEALAAGAAWETRLRVTAPADAATGGFLPPTPPPFRLARARRAAGDRGGARLAPRARPGLLTWRAGPSELTAAGRRSAGGAASSSAPSILRALLAARGRQRPGAAAWTPSEPTSGWARSCRWTSPRRWGATPTDASIFAARVRGYAGELDGEVLLEEGARPPVGLASSAAIGEAEGHVELALFRTPTATPTRPRRRTARREGGPGGELPVRAREGHPGLRRVPLLGLRRGPAWRPAAAALTAGLRRAALARRHAALRPPRAGAPRDVRGERGGDVQLLWLASPGTAPASCRRARP